MILTCPICQLALDKYERTYRCPNNHSFDIAKEGYVNLHLVQHKRSKNPGDTPEAVLARRQFLSAGFYEPLKDALPAIIHQYKPSVDVLVDIGCGEGYYTTGLASVAKQVVAVDIAKSAVQIAAKADKQQHAQQGSHSNITWVVGTGAVLPVADGVVDVCTSLFSPLPVAQMIRVLCDDGLLVMATPAPAHLYEMRQALFGEVIAHTPQKFIQTLSPEFVLLGEHHIEHEFVLNRTQLGALIAMTPYAYKAKQANRQALEERDDFCTTARFCVYVFGKC